MNPLITNFIKKGACFRSEVFTIDTSVWDLNKKSASFSFNPKERKVSNGVAEEECKGANGAKDPKTNLRKRRMSINHYKKEKSVVVILVLVSVMFAFATIPSGIVRILGVLNLESTSYEVL